MNDIRGNPWVLDTAFAGSIVKRGRVYIAWVEWSGYTNAAHRMILRDGLRGINVANWAGKSDLSPVAGNFEGTPIQDIGLQQLDSGILTIYLSSGL